MAGCRIGRGATIFPNAVLYENTVVGPRCVIHAGAVLGAYGFGYETVDGRHTLSAQLGNVVLGADVEIGAGTTIDRGTYGPTVIGEGTKIDDQVMIAHNCRIGRHNMLCSQVGIAGSTSTGDYVVMAGQVGVRDHVHIGERAVLGAMAGVINDVPDGARMIGIPATPEREQKLKQAALVEAARDAAADEAAPADGRRPVPRGRVAAIGGRWRGESRFGPIARPPGRGLILGEKTTWADAGDRQTRIDGGHQPLAAGDGPDFRVDGKRTVSSDAGAGQATGAGRRIGLIAGWGRYPVVVAETLKRQGYEVYCLGVVGHADPALADVCDDFRWIGLAKLGRAIRYFKRHGVTDATMAGKIHKIRAVPAVALAPASARPADDPHVRPPFPHAGGKDCRDDTLLGRIVDAFAADGIRFAPATDFAPDLLAGQGQLTRRGPSAGAAEATSSSAGRSPRRWAGSTSARAWPSRTRPSWPSRPSREPTSASAVPARSAGRRVHRGQGGQAAAGHAVRRAHDRTRHARNDARGRRPRAGHRGRPDDHPRSGRARRLREPQRADPRGHGRRRP